MANEKRLIYQEDAIKLLRGKCVAKYPSTFIMGLFAAADEVAKLPTVSAVEVVHGRWRWGRNSMNQYGAWCSECECGWEGKGNDFDRVQGLVIAHKYCPNCGANMRGSEE